MKGGKLSMGKAVQSRKSGPAGSAAGKPKAPRPVLTDSPGHLLRRAEQRAMNIYLQEVGADGLTPRQYVVLTAVAAYEGYTQSDLVTATGIDRSTLADMISRMIDNGALSRERTSADARANAVKLTAAGRRQLLATAAKMRKAETRMIAPLAASKRAAFLDALRIIGGEKPAR